MNSLGERFGAVLGRFLLRLIFVMSGAGKIADPAGTDAYIKQAFDSEGISPSLVFPARVAAIVFEILGGLLVILGLWARLGDLLLLVFLIIVTPIFHQFWNLADAQVARGQMINFMKNVSIAGGVLLVLAHGPGLCSFDNLRPRKQPADPTLPRS